MPPHWGKTFRTKAPLEKVLEFYMDPELHIAKIHPELVKGVRIVAKDEESVTWEQRFSLMGLTLKTVARSSLDRARNSIETESIAGTGRGTTMTRTFNALPTGTEVHSRFSPKLGPLRFFPEGAGEERLRKDDVRRHEGPGRDGFEAMRSRSGAFLQSRPVPSDDSEEAGESEDNHQQQE